MNVWKKLLAILIVAAVGVGLLFYDRIGTWLLDTVYFLNANSGEYAIFAIPFTEPNYGTVVFVGDIMLARDVERKLLKQPPGYALSAIKERLLADMVVANFEAAIPEIHVPTQSMEMKFSVLPELAESLKVSGITHLSLANNHALDYGTLGYTNTVRFLQKNGLSVAGHPSLLSDSSVLVRNLENRKVVLVNLNATYGYPDIDSVTDVIPADVTEGDLLVAYIHWGEEYEMVHNKQQESFARSLIDLGFDLVVGHHPHVVQDIESYQDGLIFYSLGNFVFDQYWQPEVQQGLMLRLVETKKNWEIELVPVESETVRIQPREMVGEVKKKFLANLAGRSSKGLMVDIAKGQLSLQF